MPQGTGIFFSDGVSGHQAELIAIVENVSNLSLNASYFTFS
jgi:hypothetical protein